MTWMDPPPEGADLIDIPWHKSKAQVFENSYGLWTVDAPGLYDTTLESREAALAWIEREAAEHNATSAKYICSCGNDWPCQDSVVVGWNTQFHSAILR